MTPEQHRRWTKLAKQGDEGIGEALALWDQTMGHVLEPGRRRTPERWAYGLGLLRYLRDLAEAVRHCGRKTLVGPMFALLRPQYEAATRAYVILHDLKNDEANRLDDALEKLPESIRPKFNLPKIEIKLGEWRISDGTKTGHSNWQRISSKHVAELHKQLTPFTILHDITHSGLTMAAHYVTVEENREQMVIAENGSRERLLEGFKQSHKILVTGTLEGLSGLNAQHSPYGLQEVSEHLDKMKSWGDKVTALTGELDEAAEGPSETTG